MYFQSKSLIALLLVLSNSAAIVRVQQPALGSENSIAMNDNVNPSAANAPGYKAPPKPKYDDKKKGSEDAEEEEEDDESTLQTGTRPKIKNGLLGLFKHGKKQKKDSEDDEDEDDGDKGSGVEVGAKIKVKKNIFSSLDKHLKDFKSADLKKIVFNKAFSAAITLRPFIEVAGAKLIKNPKVNDAVVKALGNTLDKHGIIIDSLFFALDHIPEKATLPLTLAQDGLKLQLDKNKEIANKLGKILGDVFEQHPEKAKKYIKRLLLIHEKLFLLTDEVADALKKLIQEEDEGKAYSKY